MVQEILKITGQFLLLILLQVLIFSNINFLGHINPYPYLFFVVLYRLDSNQTLFIILGFLMGFFLDLMHQTAGAHTIATLTVCFVRPTISNFAFGVNAENNHAMEYGTKLSNRITFLALIVFIHHLIYFSIAIFNWEGLRYIFLNTIYSALFTISILWLTLSLFNVRK